MANSKIASKKLKEIEREFLGNRVISSNVKNIIEQSGDAFEVSFNDPNSTAGTITVRIEAYGKGGAIRGASWGTRRPDIIIVDDIQSSEDARSETILNDEWRWFLDDIKFLGRVSRIFMIANNLGERCIIERIHRGEGDFGFICEKVPVADGLLEDSKPAWPERYTMKQILKDRDSYRDAGELSIWTRNMMCECVAEEDRIFQREMFRYYDSSDTQKIARTCNVYLRIDPSAQVKESSDPSAFVVIGINGDNNYFWLDVVNKRLKHSEKIDTVFQLCTKWDFMNVGVENSKEGIILMQDLIEQMPKRNIFFKLVELKHGNKAKEIRIEALEPLYKSNIVWFPNRADWLTEVEQQHIMFSKTGKMTLHDDIIDAAAYIRQHTQQPINHNSERVGHNSRSQSINRNSIRKTVVR